ncbi:MAG: sulfotransferase [Bacteroidota bacterium]
MSSDSKINLVYIASIGRSGSTLLESMLGAHTQIQTMGELHIWPHEIEGGGIRPCGCGKYVDDCEFWSEVRRRVDPIKQPSPGLSFFREKHNAGRTLRMSRLSSFDPNKSISAKERKEIEIYGRNNYEIFSNFLDVMREQQGEAPEWIVDASKDPYRLLWLVHSGLFNIKVIHMVKNPKAFIYSVTKSLILDEKEFNLHKRLYYTARQSVAWNIQNVLFSRIAANVLDDKDYLLINYETLATDPEGTFAQVCDKIGCEYEANAVENFRLGSVHTIAGNPMRYEKRGIVLDEKWKTRLPQSSKTLASMLTGITKSRYGYS